LFKINYRITDSFEEIRSLSSEDFHIEGFFEMVFNKNRYGNYHNKILKDGEQGLESITSWLERLLRACFILLSSDYLLISDVESYNIWVEFRKKGDLIFASVIEAEKVDGSSDLEIVQLTEVNYPNWSNEQISFDELVNEVISKTEAFISEVCRINENLQYSRMINALIEMKRKLIERKAVYSLR